MVEIFWSIIESLPDEDTVFGGSMAEAVDTAVSICEIICKDGIRTVAEFKSALNEDDLAYYYLDDARMSVNDLPHGMGAEYAVEGWGQNIIGGETK